MEVRYLPNSSTERGLFATQSYESGEVIHRLSGTELEYPTRESIHVGGNVHIVDPYGQFINHSFEPSCAIVGRFVVTLHGIVQGEEITFNYNSTEIDMASPFFTKDGKWVSGKAGR